MSNRSKHRNRNVSIDEDDDWYHEDDYEDELDPEAAMYMRGGGGGWNEGDGGHDDAWYQEEEVQEPAHDPFEMLEFVKRLTSSVREIAGPGVYSERQIKEIAAEVGPGNLDLAVGKLLALSASGAVSTTASDAQPSPMLPTPVAGARKVVDLSSHMSPAVGNEDELEGVEGALLRMDVDDDDGGDDDDDGGVPSASRPTGHAVVMPPQTQSRQKLAKRDIEAFLGSSGTGGGGAGDSLNLVVIGHVDAGKSTLMGHVLMLLGSVSQRHVEKLTKEAQSLGKDSFHFAFVLDENREERERGVTMDVGVTEFETPAGKHVTLLDAPGHRDFVSNMISGAARADAAILVVDARPGEYESGFGGGGQTREHVLLARSLGVTSLIVAVNKLDAVEFSRARYDEIVDSLSRFLRQSGFRVPDAAAAAAAAGAESGYVPSPTLTASNQSEAVPSAWTTMFIPLSGLTGANLHDSIPKPDGLSWFKGPNLVTAIDALPRPVRDVSVPLRMTVADTFKSIGQGGVAVSGKVEAGVVGLGDKLAVLPVREVALVRSIERGGQAVSYAAAGQNVTLGLSLIERNMVRAGSVLCDPKSLVPVVRAFKARIATSPDLRVPLLRGSRVLLFSQSGQETAVITDIVGQLNKSTGELLEKVPRTLGPNVTADVIVRFETELMCLELYRDYRQLGRFSMRQKTATVGSGIVTAIIEAKS